VELVRAVCTEMKAKCELVVPAWDGMIPGLLARKYDVIMSSMSITQERAKRVLFSEAYCESPSAWFGKKEMDLDVTSRESLKGKKVGVQRGTLPDNYLSDNFADVAEVKRYSALDALALDLIGGRLDVVLQDVLSGELRMTKNNNFEKGR
jgi:arginine/ornithine transport system substrate-binding protein